MDAIRQVEEIRSKIRRIRGVPVILDFDLAELYSVETRVLNQAVRRNLARFPTDFAFRLTSGEFEALRSQLVISSSRHGGRRHLPYAFTEFGAIMVANILRSPCAVDISVHVVRAFVQLREFAGTHRAILQKLEELETSVGKHDEAIRMIGAVLEQLASSRSRASKIGFETEAEKTTLG